MHHPYILSMQVVALIYTPNLACMSNLHHALFK
jgi:hypothetical protein